MGDKLNSIVEEVSPAAPDVELQFKRLLGRHGIGVRLAQLEVVETGLPAFSATFLYPRFRQEKVLVDELCEKLVSRVTSFCMTREDRRLAKAEDAESEYETAATDTLNARARRLFIQATKSSSRSGEGGELLLFILAEEYLKAPLLVSKMRLKTNTQMPVHGSDGIHAAWDSKAGAMVLYFGESKLHATLTGAVTDAMNSVAELASDDGGRYQHELTLAQNYSDLDGMPKEMKEEMLRFLNPWDTMESSKRIDKFAILIGYDERMFEDLKSIPRSQVEDKFKELYAATVRRTMGYAQKKMQEKGIHLESVELFFLPLPESTRVL